MMKKVIFFVIIVGMLGWSVNEFIISSEESKGPEQDVEVEKNASNETQKKDEEKVVDESDEIGLNQGDIAPDFELKTLEGETVKLSDFRGKPVMLNFWATWCPPCRAEMPDMQNLYKKKGKDIEILAVNLHETEENTQTVQDFVDKLNLTFTILLDEEIKVANLYQIQPIPTSFMIDSDGRIQYMAYGAMNYEMMIQMVEMIK